MKGLPSFPFGAFFLPEEIIEANFSAEKGSTGVGLQLGWTLRKLGAKSTDRGTV